MTHTLQVATTRIANGEIVTAVELHTASRIETFGEGLSLEEQEVVAAAVNRKLEAAGYEARACAQLLLEMRLCFRCTVRTLLCDPGCNRLAPCSCACCRHNMFAGQASTHVHGAAIGLADAHLALCGMFELCCNRQCESPRRCGALRLAPQRHGGCCR
jgi:hypothetical protein